MKTLNLLKNMRNLQLAVVAIILLAVGLGCSGSFSVGKPEAPTTEQQNSLAKQTLSEFTKAIESESFTGFMSSTSKEFQSQLSADKMKSSFSSMIEKKEDVMPVLKDAEGKTPQFSGTPAVTEQSGNYLLNLAGSFPSEPAKTNFNFQYVWQDSQWKLLKIEVKM